MNELANTVQSTTNLNNEGLINTLQSKQSGNQGHVIASSQSRNQGIIEGQLKQMQKSEGRIQSQMRMIEATSTHSTKNGKKLVNQLAGADKNSLPQLNHRKTNSKGKSQKSLKFLSKEKVSRDQTRKQIRSDQKEKRSVNDTQDDQINQSGQSAKMKNPNASEYKDKDPSIFDQNFNTEISQHGSQNESMLNRRQIKQKIMNSNNIDHQLTTSSGRKNQQLKVIDLKKRYHQGGQLTTSNDRNRSAMDTQDVHQNSVFKYDQSMQSIKNNQALPQLKIPLKSKTNGGKAGQIMKGMVSNSRKNLKSKIIDNYVQQRTMQQQMSRNTQSQSNLISQRSRQSLSSSKIYDNNFDKKQYFLRTLQKQQNEDKRINSEIMAGNQILNSTANSNDSELHKMKSLKTNGIVDEYSGSVVAPKQMSKIQSVQNFSKESELQMKERRGEQLFSSNNVAYSNDDHGIGASRMKVNKSVESLKRIKQNHNKSAMKQPPNEIKLISNFNRGDVMPKIHSTTDMSKGLNFSNKFVKTKINRDQYDMEYGSTSLLNIKESQMMDSTIHEQNDYPRSEISHKKGNGHRLNAKGSPDVDQQTYNSLQNIKIYNPSKKISTNDPKNRTSLTELKKRNQDIESKLKNMDQQRKQLQLQEFKGRKSSQQTDEQTFQKKFQRIMRKDEKVEYAIGKIQKDFMRYTQLKIHGFKTLMASDRNDGEENSPKKSSRFHNIEESPNRGDLTTKSKRKTNNKSSLSFAGKLVMMEEKRGRGVGFEGHSAMQTHNRKYSKELQQRFNSIDTTSDKNKAFYQHQQKAIDSFEDENRERSSSQRMKLRGKMMREMYNKKLNHIFLSNDHRANFYRGEVNHIIEQIEGFKDW